MEHTTPGQTKKSKEIFIKKIRQQNIQPQKIKVMKKQSNTLFATISNRVLTSLTTEVKETIAFDLVAPQHKIFTTADLWNIQRQTRARAQRRFL